MIRHQDLKPGKILVHGQQVRICDFGSAYDHEPPDHNEPTEAERPPGTRRYKAPEVLGVPNVERRHNNAVDVYSLGCVFLEIYTILSEQTLDMMAEFMTGSESSEFRGDWVYALSLEHDEITRWLSTIRGKNGRGEMPSLLIRSMAHDIDLAVEVCLNRSDRKSASKLAQEVKYSKYIGDCCIDRALTSSPSTLAHVKYLFTESSADSKPVHPNSRPPERVPMGFHMTRPIQKCQIGRREQKLNDPRHYGMHNYFVDHSQRGLLEVRENLRKDRWETTRQIRLEWDGAVSIIEECR
ncbi:hypothetical protein ACLMJK_007151 [Lecanora helva]